tara:strand:- start:681 stop:866 length:186 start_codon:yes stop_codon:yes gene_type:complete
VINPIEPVFEKYLRDKPRLSSKTYEFENSKVSDNFLALELSGCAAAMEWNSSQVWVLMIAH